MPNGLYWIHRARLRSLMASSRVASTPVNRTSYSVSSVSRISLKGYCIWGCDGRKYSHFPGLPLFATAFISRTSDVLLCFSLLSRSLPDRRSDEKAYLGITPGFPGYHWTRTGLFGFHLRRPRIDGVK